MSQLENNFTAVDDSDKLVIGVNKKSGITRFRTGCCALGSISLNNETSIESIKNVLSEIKSEYELDKASHFRRDGGERAIFVMTLPRETELEEKLKECGFEHIYSIHRRNYAPEEEMLKMWIISW